MAIYIYIFVISFILTWCWYIYHTHVREYIFVHLAQGAYIGDSGTCNLQLLAIRISFPKGWTGQCDEATQDFGGGKWFMLMLGVFFGGGIRNESFLSERNDWLPEWMVQNTKRPSKFVVGLVPQFWSHGYMIFSSRWFKCNRLDPKSMPKTSLMLAIQQRY